MVAGRDRHVHGPAPGTDARWLYAALTLILAFMAGEVVAGIAAHSLALISDAAHMLTDAASIALVLVTGRLAARPPAGGSAADRHGAPRSLNLAGAFKHIVTDLYAFAATAVAGLVILLTGFDRADAIATLVVVVLMVYAGAGLIRQSGRIFLEAAPAGLDPAAVGAAMASRPHVTEVHDLHIWEITSGMPAASAHVLVAPGEDCHAVRADLEAYLSREYGITHATLQVDHAGLPTASGLIRLSQEQHCDDAHGPAYRPGDGG